MHWDSEAERIIDNMAIPPVMAGFARLDAERRAMQAGLASVTPEVARAAEKGYGRVFGSEATEVIRRMGRGEDVGLPDAFFEDDEGELYKIDLCPAKYGACTKEKRDLMLEVLLPLRETLRRLDTTRIIMGRARTPLMSHHVLRVAIIGCPNCCASPYFADFGVICQLRPEIQPGGCNRCGRCVRSCAEGAISFSGDAPEVDYGRCILCGACAQECANGCITMPQRGYKVVIGGTGSRHPQLARTAAAWTDAAGAAGLLEKLIIAFRDFPEKKEISFHELVDSIGIDVLR